MLLQALSLVQPITQKYVLLWCKNKNDQALSRQFSAFPFASPFLLFSDSQNKHYEKRLLKRKINYKRGHSPSLELIASAMRGFFSSFQVDTTLQFPPEFYMECFHQFENRLLSVLQSIHLFVIPLCHPTFASKLASHSKFLRHASN